LNSESFQVYLSALEEERFGIRTARAVGVTVENLHLVMDFCLNNQVVFLIARCSCTNIKAAQAMEREGFSLMDTLVYYVRDLTKTPIPRDLGKFPLRPIRPGEEEAVRTLAAESFQGYAGHYHADERLDRNKCDETYTSWAVRSCLFREVADEVLVADQGGTLVAFTTLRLNNPEEGEWVLGGVSPSARGEGIYWSIIICGMEWGLAKGVKRMIISTQLTNVAVQTVWTRLEFVPSHTYYTFHKWFEK
jgi:RimJ/RimL family protein N-acetyltransferase